MKKNILICCSLLLWSTPCLFAQKIISEGTLYYNIRVHNLDKPSEIIDSAVSAIYLKGVLSRTDFTNTLGSETTIHDAKDETSVILKQYSGQKLMITLTKENWLDKFKKYKGVTFQITDETKKIANYNCIKAIAKLSNGATFVIYYTPDIDIFYKQYNPIFKELPGLPVKYEYVMGNLIFQYTLSSIDLNPVSSEKFEIPKSGYRVMTYDASR